MVLINIRFRLLKKRYSNVSFQHKTIGAMSTEEWKIATLQLRLLTKHIRYKINQVECFFFGAVISQFFSKMIYQFINDNDGAEAIKKKYRRSFVQ